MESSVERKFKETIEIAFGEDSWKDEELLNKYNKVIKKRDEILNNGKAEDGYGEFGGNPTTIELMLYVRKLMRENKLIPAEPLKSYLHGKPLTEEEFKDFIKQDGKTRSWLTKEYEKLFHESYESEPKSHLTEYFENGWDYSKYQKENSLDADIEWLFEFKGKLDHIYYNELDHYLTYLAGAILEGAKRKNNNPCDRSWRGVHIKEDLKRMSV